MLLLCIYKFMCVYMYHLLTILCPGCCLITEDASCRCPSSHEIELLAAHLPTPPVTIAGVKNLSAGTQQLNMVGSLFICKCRCSGAGGKRWAAGRPCKELYGKKKGSAFFPKIVTWNCVQGLCLVLHQCLFLLYHSFLYLTIAILKNEAENVTSDLKKFLNWHKYLELKNYFKS